MIKIVDILVHQYGSKCVPAIFYYRLHRSSCQRDETRNYALLQPLFTLFSSFLILFQVTAMELQSNKPSSLPSVQPFHALIYPFSLLEMLEISRKYAAKARMNVALTDTRFTFKPKPKSSRLKIGYVSSDFGNHPMSQLMQSGET